MSFDGADRRKIRIRELADYIRDQGRSGITINKTVTWSILEQGLTKSTAREYINSLLDGGKIVLVSKDQRLRHIDIFPPTSHPTENPAST